VTWGVREDGWTRQRIESHDSPSDGTHDVPDVDDDATRGCILGLVRKVWGDPLLHLTPSYMRHDGDLVLGWVLTRASGDLVVNRNGVALWGATEAEALLAGLETEPCSWVPRMVRVTKPIKPRRVSPPCRLHHDCP